MKSKILFFTLALSMLLVGCSKKEGDDYLFSVPAQIFKYADGLKPYGVSDFVYDGESMQLFYGLRYNKIWLGVAEKVANKYVPRYEWTGGDDVENSITVNQPYQGSEILNLSTVEAHGIKGTEAKFAFTVNLSYDYQFINAKLITDNLGTIHITDLEQKRFFLKDWIDNYFLVYYYGDGSECIPWCYSYDGEEMYKFASNSSMWYFNAWFRERVVYIFLISFEEGIVIFPSEHICLRLNFRTGESLWSSQNIVFPDVPNNARYDSWQVDAKDGAIWTVSANITLYSGEKTVRSFYLNIDTGEINYIELGIYLIL